MPTACHRPIATQDQAKTTEQSKSQMEQQMAKSPAPQQQGGATGPTQQQGQDSAPAPQQQQQGGQTVFRDWAAI